MVKHSWILGYKPLRGQQLQIKGDVTDTWMGFFVHGENPWVKTAATNGMIIGIIMVLYGLYGLYNDYMFFFI